ncbi:alpha-galactosidase [Streptomyces deccanensis]|uniref:alpha-galactosidase n=1 Tax=Streptomyces deccanensis TaxID=424188 RepID=UPI001EFAF047|nr:alpha-galactosidase [Streptomyces deccanensis]ULR56206.1 alpha-galactosidase [Streptomyces deccanensis]
MIGGSGGVGRAGASFTWGHPGIASVFATASDGTLRLVRLGPSGDTVDPETALPLVELTAFGHGSGWSGPRFTGTAFGARLVYRGHCEGDGAGGGDWARLTVELHDPATGLTAFVELSSPAGVPVLRSRVRLRNDGAEPLVVQSVSSLLLGGLPSPDLLDVHRARNDWLAECRWYAEPLRATVADISVDAHQHDSRAALALTGRGSWPSDGHLAMGALTERDGRRDRGAAPTEGGGGRGRAWVWQVESPAGWRWDLGERARGTYLALNGPTDAEHQWRVRLAPGDTFTTVAAALALGSGGGSGLDEAWAALTAYRRAVRRPHPDHDTLPVVFNDYMNTLMGDPTTAKLLPLIDAAADAGAEYFCIDSGWYDDTVDGGWWDSVGAWLPSARRFPPGGVDGGMAREAGAGAGTEPEPEPGTGPEAWAGTEADTEPETWAGAEPEANTEPEAGTEAEAGTEPGAWAGADVGAGAAAGTQAEAGAGAEAGTEAEAGAGAEVGTDPEARSATPSDSGIRAVLDRIRERGMVPGLWLEPEVVGVRSAVAAELPPEAFFRRDGVRLAEQGRHQLDLRHPAARAHLDKTVDRLVGDWGVGYLKLDYNIVIDPGTTAPGDLSPGAGLLGHARAYLDWLSGVLDRYPHLVVENCASGGMRMDGATLAVAQLQSTSDQQDPLRYPPIAAAAPTAVPPEQGAVWAYPQPEYEDDLIAFTLGGALLGRIHLSGHLDRMTERQLALVREAVGTYKSIRGDLARAVPFWPLGLPGWTDAWSALGLRVPEGHGPTYLSVWRRGGEPEVRLSVGHLAASDAPVRTEILHPSTARADSAASWDPTTGELRVWVPRTPGVLLIRLTPEDATGA